MAGNHFSPTNIDGVKMYQVLLVTSDPAETGSTTRKHHK